MNMSETLYSRAVEPAHLPLGILKSVRKTSRRKGVRRTKYRNSNRRHYKLVCISLYARDIQKLEEHLRYLKGKGYTKANKSQIIRFAIDQVMLDQMPRVY